MLCGGATELAGFTRAVTKHLLSCRASLSPSSSSPASRLLLPILPLPHLLLFFFFFFDVVPSSPATASCSFWYRAASIWKLVSIVRTADLLPALSYRVYLLLRATDQEVLQKCWFLYQSRVPDEFATLIEGINRSWCKLCVLNTAV